MKQKGRKFDKDKRRWDLVPFNVLDMVVDILTHGAKKYGSFNWLKVELHRYQAALMRHYSAYMQGEHIDKDSGMHHLSHVIVNAMFMLYKEIENGNTKNSKK